MRDVAKSFGRFSWTMWVFGLDQMRRLVADEYSGHRGEAVRGAFDTASDATLKLLSERARRVYDAGDKLQQESVDMFFDIAKPSTWAADKVVEKAADAVSQSADAMRDWAKEKTKTSPSAAASRRH
jgi:hypothetical protein